MSNLQAECVIRAQNELGEGPVWDDRLGELFWVDINGCKLHRFRPSDGRQSAYSLERKVGSAVPAADGSWILAMADGFYRLDLDSGRTERIVHTDEPDPLNRLNDGKCDRNGRFWAGTMSAKWQKDGSLYTLESGGKLTRRLSGVVCSNGLAWNADNTILYYIDSAKKLVHAFDYDAASGNISNRRTVIAYPEGQGGPDGMTIDSEGMLWIGHWGGWQVSRWNPLTGEKLLAVDIPARNVTSCAFGGKQLDELYVTTARVGNEGEDMTRQPLAGSVFRVRTGVRGLPVCRAEI